MGAPLRVLSLCSGIGGLDLGVCRALGGRVVAYVERDPYAASVLLARMEDKALDPAPVWVGDLRELDARPLAGHVDVVCGGYPCQPFSLAGKRLGEADPRHLWPGVARIIRQARPRYVCLENVSGHLRLGFDAVLADLDDLGFDAEWTTLRAADVGAPHLRRRLFVLAHAHGTGEGREQPGRRGCSDGEDTAWPGGDGSQEYVADANLRGRGRVGVGGLLDGERATLGDHADGCGEDVAHAQDYHGRRGERRAEEGTGQEELRGRGPSGCGETLADANGGRREELRVTQPGRVEGPRGGVPDGRGEVRELEHAPFPDTERDGLEGLLQARSAPGATERNGSWWAVEPDVGRVADGVPARVDRLRCLGNAVVPQQAEHAFRELLGRTR